MEKAKQPSPFKREFERAEKQMEKMREISDLIKKKLDGGDVQNANLAAFSLAEASERLSLLTRRLPSYSGNPQAQKITEQIITENANVKMGFTPEGWFGVVMPVLLPKKNKGSTDYIREIMYLAMENFFRGKPPVRYTDCIIIFRHIYRYDRPERQNRDHDNIEVKAVIDIIALYVLFDDSPLYCSHYYCSAPGDENRTEIFIVPKPEFESWFIKVNNKENKEIILHENLN